MDGKTPDPERPAPPPEHNAAAGRDEALSPNDAATVDALLHDPAALQVPPVESVFFESLLAGSQITDEMKALARAYHDDGFVVLQDVFEPELVDALVGKYEWLFDPATIGTLPPHVQELFNLDPARRLDAWWVCEEVRQLACHPRVLELLGLLYGRRPVPFQTLNFKYGTQQPTHSDAIHFWCIPSGYMCGVWVALEEVTLENGALVYYPGSHKLPEVQLAQLGQWGMDGYTSHGSAYRFYENYVRAIVRDRGLEEKKLTVPKGSVLIWAANLLHGGSAVTRPGVTRISQVTHYYFEGCTYYAPILSNPALGEYKLKDVIDLTTKEPVPHTINGEPITVIPGTDGRSRIARAGTETQWGFDPALMRRMEQLKAELDRPGAGGGGDPAVDAAELQRLRAYVKTMEVERDHLRHRVDQLDEALRQAPGSPFAKALRAVKSRMGPRSGPTT